MLITVQSKRDHDQKRLQERVTDHAAAYLQQAGIEASVISQASLQNEETKKWVREYGISEGKASLIAKLVQADASVQPGEWADLSIRDIRKKANENNMAIDDKQTGATASIRAEQALQIALQAAGFDENEVAKLEIEWEYEKGRPTYEVEFYVGQTKYEYDIDAATGAILDTEIKPRPTGSKNDNTSGTADPLKPPADAIGLGKALSIALGHLGVTENQVAKLEIEQEREDGKWIYEVEFVYDNKEYEYEIDAVSGQILEISIEPLPGSGSQAGKPQPGAPTAGVGEEIGTRQALSIALQHLGVAESQVAKLEVEREREDGKWIYEVEFVYQGKEYEYEIDAVSGQILEISIETLPDSAGSKPQPGAPTAGTEDEIGPQQALAIALRHLGVTESQISKLEIEREREDGKWVYEVEFVYQGKEYEYEIDAVSGEVLEVEISQ